MKRFGVILGLFVAFLAGILLSNNFPKTETADEERSEENAQVDISTDGVSEGLGDSTPDDLPPTSASSEQARPDEQTRSLPPDFWEKHVLRHENREIAAELKDLIDKASEAGVPANMIFIQGGKAGTMAKLFEGSEMKKIIAWNATGKKIFPTNESAWADGFLPWEFYPSSKAAEMLDERLRENGFEAGYTDDLLYVVWEGLFDSIYVAEEHSADSE